MTRAAAFGVQTVALPSAGNAAGAATAYAARAGIRCVIFVPEDTPPANILESACGGSGGAGERSDQRLRASLSSGL